MARRKKRQRDTNVIATPVLSPIPTNLYLRAPLVRRSPLQHVEDRREFHPSPIRPLAVTRSGAARLRTTRRRSSHLTAARLSQPVTLHQPARIPVCLRRLQRKKVLFALQRTGKGARSRHRRRNEHSSISCRG